MIVDVGLGEASGIAAVKAILRSGFVPHVFVTGEAFSGVSLGPDTVLIRKPFRVSDLDQAIQRALATERRANALAASWLTMSSLDRQACGDQPPEMAQETQLAAITPMSRELPAGSDSVAESPSRPRPVGRGNLSNWKAT